MTDESTKKDFWDMFNLKFDEKLRVNINWKAIEKGLYVQEEFLHNGVFVNFPEFVCGLAKKHEALADQNGNSITLETPHPVLKASGTQPTLTSVVPDDQGHLRGCVEITDDLGNSAGRNPVYFGLTDSSFFYTEANGGACYVDLTKPNEGVQVFKEGTEEYDCAIKPAAMQIAQAVSAFGLGAQESLPAEQ